MDKHSDWKKAGTGVVDRLFKYRFVQQFAALSYKNVLVAWRSRRSTGLRLFAPFIFLLLALITHLALDANNALQERFTAVHESVGSPIPPIPSCGADLYIAGRPCVDFVWTPSNDTQAQAIVDAIRSTNDPPIPPDKVVGFRTRREADDFMMTHPDGCLGAVHFSRSGPGTFNYVITSNSTVKYFKGAFQDPVNFFQMPMINAVARELARSYVAAATNTTTSSSSSSSGFSWSPQLVRFPHPSLQSMNLLGQVLASFIFASLMFNCVSQISGLVCERDAGLRLSLSNMGMSQAAYWTSWMAFDVVLTAATALLLVVAGIVLRFDFFVKNDFGLLLLLFWLFSLAMTSFSYALSCLVKKPQGAMYLGFSVFIVGWMFQTIQFLAKLPYTPATYYSTSNKWGRVFFWVFALYPWNGLTKGILDLNEATLSPADPGLRSSQLYDYCRYEPDPGAQPPYDPRQEFRTYDCIYPLWQVYLTLLCQWVGYWLLAVYLSNVLPNEVGARRSVLYPLQPSYWWPKPGDTAAELQQLMADEAAGVGGAPPVAEGLVDPDVEAEEAKMRGLLEERAGLMGAMHCKDTHVQDNSSSSNSEGQYAAELYGLSKVFRGGPTPLSCRPAFMCKPCMTAHAHEDADEDSLLQAVTAGANTSSSSRRGSSGGNQKREDFWALRGTWLGIERGRLFCLLGPNGAGKTTTINCLTGVLPFSGGAALIYGNSIKGEAGLDAVRPLMGVCPQFDVLWPELSGREHLIIAGHIKGRPWNKVSAEAADLLSRVQLSGSSGLRSGSYSGGMKRRLSVALALLGDPRIVYLDEPTTGMDPISRRHVWDIITAAKPGRAIVLTTHSMEEADVLGDRIAIMARGRIRALGSSIRLKQKYGSGYQLSVHVGLPPSVDASSLTAPQQQQQLEKQVEVVKQVFRSGLGLEAVDEARGVLRYLVPQSVPQAELVAFLQALEAGAGQLGVDDIQASLASLEEVFLNIAKQAELEAAAATGSSLVGVDLPGGGTLMVPLGEEEVIGPDGVAYDINWSQDDQGRLVVLSCTVKPSQQLQQQYVVLEGLQEQQGPVLQQQLCRHQLQEQQQQHWTPQQQQQQRSQLASPDMMSGVQLQQQSPASLDQGVHARHHPHHHQMWEQQQQQQQQQSGHMHAVRPAQHATAVLPVGQEGAVSEAPLPRLSECIRKFTPRGPADSKPHAQ